MVLTCLKISCLILFQVFVIKISKKHRLTFADVNSKSIQVDLKLLQNLISSNNHMSDFL